MEEIKSDTANPTNQSHISSTDSENYIDLTNNEIIYIIFKVFDYFLHNLDEDEDNLGVPHIFVSGEYDSNQTDFERKCNQLEIGVLSSYEVVGKACLPLLRAIIDNNLDGLFYRLTCINEEEFDKNTHPLEVADILAEFESQYGSAHPITKNPQVTLMGIRDGVVKELVINKKVDEMDLYTLPRIIRLFYDLVMDEMDENEKDYIDPFVSQVMEKINK